MSPAELSRRLAEADRARALLRQATREMRAFRTTLRFPQADEARPLRPDHVVAPRR